MATARRQSRNIRSELRTVDTAARFGGDEFAILLTDPVPDEVLVIARRVQDRIAEPVVLAGQELSITASAGIATSASGYTDPEDVLRDADIAMYEAKAAARGSASLFDPEMHARASGRLAVRRPLGRELDDQCVGLRAAFPRGPRQLEATLLHRDRVGPLRQALAQRLFVRLSAHVDLIKHLHRQAPDVTGVGHGKS